MTDGQKHGAEVEGTTYISIMLVSTKIALIRSLEILTVAIGTIPKERGCLKRKVEKEISGSGQITLTIRPLPVRKTIL